MVYLDIVAYVEEQFPSILFAKDGEVYDLNGLQAIAIGGAFSIDWMYRIPGRSWWPDEQPSKKIKAHVEKKLDDLGWKVDVVLSHKLMLPDLIFRLVPKANIRPLFLQQLINHPQYRSTITGLATGTAGSMPNISKQKLLELAIPLPPVEHQTCLEPLIAQADKSKYVAQKATTNIRTYGIL